ncbi:lipopolysaccharide heptosyltransferase I [Pelotalea chapellei]|uniref:Lipopolysaccharide heptosyltransferase 1 n=1 Tax=Pelotalea chapellei TaxID=44671 RepID=A0ABS5U6T2_9BACT|nr:lipopolysaccharide heptosyltransferase I [Pelotalea chapellei]MBT1071373.1 lipopolysaccharide heptosyltransferase I [Pelotalea chapellei]
MRIALVRLSSLGDIILCLASLQIIRRHLPDSHITWVADRRFADILDHHPDIQQVIKIDLKTLQKQKSLSGILEEYRRLRSVGKFDVIIDLHGMIKSAAISSILGGKVSGFDRKLIKEPLSSLFYNCTYHVPLELPAVSRYAALTSMSLGLDLQQPELCPPQPYLHWTTADNTITDPYFSKERRNILLVPETSAPYKNYPPKKYARLASLLGENILICHGNQQELEAAKAIAEQHSHIRLLPRLNLNQLKAAVGRSDLVIGGDSGPTHIAWACGVPSITLFGATPVCICPTPINRVIKTSSQVNLRKPNSGDVSVRDISEEEVLALAHEILNG